MPLDFAGRGHDGRVFQDGEGQPLAATPPLVSIREKDFLSRVDFLGKPSHLGESVSATEDETARRHLEESGEIKLRRRRIIESRVLKTVEDIVRSRFAHEHQARLAGLLERVMERELDPYTAASRLLRDVYED